MKNIAVTGSFASGKSYVMNILNKMGYRIFLCDDYVKNLYQNVDIQNMIIKAIDGLEVFDKAKLAEIIYHNDDMRKKLEAIIHPMVRSGIKDFEQNNAQEKLIFTEVPLLYESGFNQYFNFTICVYCSENTRLKRAIDRGLKSMAIYEKVKKIQLNQENKIKMADFVIDSESEILSQIKNIITEIT